MYIQLNTQLDIASIQNMYATIEEDTNVIENLNDIQLPTCSTR